MGVEVMLRHIEAEAHAEVEDLRRQADERAEAIVASAEEAVRARVAAALERAAPAVRAQAARRVEASRLRLLEQRARVEASRTQAAHALAARLAVSLAAEPASPRWQAGLARIAEETLASVGSGATVRCRPADAVSLAERVAASGGHLEVDPSLAPGLVARSADGRIEVDATLPVRLARARAHVEA